MERGDWEIDEVVLRAELSTEFWQVLGVSAPETEPVRRRAIARSVAPPSSNSVHAYATEYSIEGQFFSDDGPPPWMIGFSKQFKKDTRALDRKMMGRILEVISEVADYSPPFEPRGDTFKPLSGDLSGYWRYRIGDHRLLLEPQPRRATINLLSFGARGSVYD